MCKRVSETMAVSQSCLKWLDQPMSAYSNRYIKSFQITEFQLNCVDWQAVGIIRNCINNNSTWQTPPPKTKKILPPLIIFPLFTWRGESESDSQDRWDTPHSESPDQSARTGPRKCGKLYMGPHTEQSYVRCFQTTPGYTPLLNNNTI